VNSAATNKSPLQNFEKKGVKERKKKEVRNNKNSNYVLLDSVHRLYHGVLYFHNVIYFHGTAEGYFD